MVKYYFRLSRDYVGTDELITYRIEFKDQAIVDSQYQGKIDLVPYEELGRAGRVFVIQKEWEGDKARMMHLFWQVRSFSKYNAITEDGKTVKAEDWIINAIKADLKIKRFNVVYKSAPYESVFNV
jgi:hypothetical protein